MYERFLDGWGLPPDEGLRESLYGAFSDLANYALFDDVAPALAALRGSGVTLGIVSNFEEWLERLLERLGVADEFDVRVISGLEGIEKPDPRIYRLALERAGVEPERSAFVGDSPEFDVDPPAALGMFPVLIDRRERHPSFGGVRIGASPSWPASWRRREDVHAEEAAAEIPRCASSWRGSARRAGR